MTRKRLVEGLQQNLAPALKLLALLDFSDSYMGLLQPSSSKWKCTGVLGGSALSQLSLAPEVRRRFAEVYRV